MTEGEFEITEGTASKVVEVVVNQAKPGGWMAWYRMSTASYFSQVYGDFDFTRRDFYKCPSPLFVSREEAVDAARKNMGNSGGEIRLVRIEL